MGLKLNSMVYIKGLGQDCSNSSELAMELLQSCIKPSIYQLHSEFACILWQNYCAFKICMIKVSDISYNGIIYSAEL